MVGLEIEGEKHMLLYLPRSNGVHEDWTEESERQTARAARSLCLCLCYLQKRCRGGLLCT